MDELYDTPEDSIADASTRLDPPGRAFFDHFVGKTVVYSDGRYVEGHGAVQWLTLEFNDGTRLRFNMDPWGDGFWLETIPVPNVPPPISPDSL